MKTAKKALGVLVAIAMLVNVFAVLSFAITPDTAIDLSLSTDKQSYKAGEVVTFTISVETISEITALGVNGNYPIGYNSKVINPIGAVDDLASYNIKDLQGGYDDTISGVFPITNEGEVDTSKGWDAGLMLSLADDASTFQVNGKVDVLTFQMKLADNVADGDYVVGFNAPSFAAYEGYINGYFGATGEESGVSTANTFGYGYTTIHVGEAAAASILKPMSSQIRFKGVGSDADFTKYGGTFDVRTRATIAKADFDAKFTDEATAITGISEFGFVYAAKSNVDSFDLETAKGVAQGTGAEGYVKQTCNYMQRTDAGYNFTCLISGIADADHTDAVSSIAYVCFNGEYIFFDAPATADFDALYTAWKK